MAAPDGETLAGLCTIITTTSPTPSNPSTELIFSTLESLAEYAPELLECRHIIVCDGYKCASDSKFRSGVVTAERAHAYEQYMDILELQAQKASEVDPSDCSLEERLWRKVSVVRLAERQGFGFAVKAALELVQTRFVCVMQHDRTFMRPFHDVLPLLKAMMADEQLKMVGLPTTTNDPSKYITQAITKLGEMKVHHPPFESLVVTSPVCPQLRFIPMIMWHDSTHFASTEYYRSFVFGRRRRLVTKGGFIEDKLGQEQGMDLRNIGWRSHANYGTFLLDDGAPAPARMVGHLDGKRYLRIAAKMALEASERARHAAASSPERDSIDGDAGGALATDELFRALRRR